MKAKQAIVICFFVLSGLLLISPAEGASSIEQVRNKPVLDDSDLQVIDKFISIAVNNIYNIQDFTTASKLRSEITTKRSTQGQYAQQYSDSSYKYISEALTKARTINSPSIKSAVLNNLLLLIEDLDENRLRQLAVSQLTSEIMVVRYQAVRTLYNQDFIALLNSGQRPSDETVQDIINKMQQLIDTSCPEVIGLIAQFAAEIDTPQAGTLLLNIADLRIRQYTDWSVKSEIIDGTILKLLQNKISTTPAAAENEAFAQRFAQLYSYVIQRYAKARELSEIQRQQLLTVIIKTEETCINILSGQTQTELKKAIEQKDTQALLNAHSQLLGSPGSLGLLPSKLGFTYSNRQTQPMALSAQPLVPGQ